VLLGQMNPRPVDIDQVAARLAQPEYAAVSRSLGEIGMHSAVDLFATYAGNARDVAPWLRDAQINRDRNLRLQYLAGRGLNLYKADAIFAEMAPYAKDPAGLFVGSDQLLQTLLQKIRSTLAR
jgi:spermidine synthase